MKNTFYILVLIISLASFSCSKQEGCIDPNAANYIYEAKKDDGSCLYDMSFYMNSGKHGPVYIYIDGALKDSLFCALPGRKPRCGIDTVAYDNLGNSYRCIINVAMKAGEHDVKVEAVDGTVWEEKYTLPANCLQILIDAAD